MPKWIHDRAQSLKKDMEKTYGPEKAEQVAFAVATQQAHRLGKSPKTFKSKVTGKKERFGTPEAKKRAKTKFDKPRKEYKKTAELGDAELASDWWEKRAAMVRMGSFVDEYLEMLEQSELEKEAWKSKFVQKLVSPRFAGQSRTATQEGLEGLVKRLGYQRTKAPYELAREAAEVAPEAAAKSQLALARHARKKGLEVDPAWAKKIEEADAAEAAARTAKTLPAEKPAPKIKKPGILSEILGDPAYQRRVAATHADLSGVPALVPA